MTGYSNGTNGSANHFEYGDVTQSNGVAHMENTYTNGNGYMNGDGYTNGNGHMNGDGHINGNGHMNTNGYTNGHTNGHTHTNGIVDTNGDSCQNAVDATTNTHRRSIPVAICGMACRVPGGIHSPAELWSFLLAGQDARGPVPSSRYNISAYYAPNKKPGSVITQQGYFLDSTNDLAALDTSFFSMPRAEVETLDPQQRMLLEVSREALDDSGETGWKGSNIGVYVGSYGQDWYDISVRDTQAHGIYQILGPHDFMVSNRLSHELDLHGPSVTIRTACSGSIIGVNEACMAIARGDCTSAIVGGSNIIMAPALTAAESEKGVLSSDGSCNTFSANANGYARGEGIVAIYLKPLTDAIRDGSPIRAVITGSAINHNGHTPTIAQPSSKAQEALIRQAYRNAGIVDIAKTGFFECHGTGTRTGDPIETAAVSACFGKAGVHIGSVKANLGHAGGAAGLVGILKAVLALENRTIPPNIKSLPHNPAIPFESNNLIVPTEPTPWPTNRDERASVSSFGLGGSNAHVILESAASFNVGRRHETSEPASNEPHLLLFSANTPASLKAMVEKYKDFLDKNPSLLSDVAYTLANRREHLPHRTFALCANEQITLGVPASSGKVQQNQKTSLVMVFTGQGAQWPRMGYELLRPKTNPVFRNTIASLDKALQELGPLAPSWTIDEELRKPARKSRIDEAEFAQPLSTALQIALVDTYASIGIRPTAVVGHSSGEVAAAYAAGGLSAREAIVVAFLRGLITTRKGRKGAMGALGMSWEAAKKHLVPGVVLACDNAPNSVTISGDTGPVEETVKSIKQSGSGVLATMLKVEKAYHSSHMQEIGKDYHRSMVDANVVGKPHTLPFFSSVSGELFAPTAKSRFGPKYWQQNLECPVLFTSAVSSAVKQHIGSSNQIFLEVGSHAALAGPLRQILTHNSSSASYISTLTRRTNSAECWLSALGQLFAQHVPFNLQALIPAGNALSDLPPYPWDHHRSHWRESRIAHEWRMRKHPHHDLLGAKVPDSTDLEPVWRNVLHIDNAPWLRDHKINAQIIFPFSGYVAMAAEAIRQITGIEEAVEFRNVAVRSALVLNEDSPQELVTNFHRLRLTDSLDSEWWGFSIASHNGHTWTRHCSGEVQALDEKDKNQEIRDHVATAGDLPRKASSKRWYDVMRRDGLDYGYHFESLQDITTTTVGTRTGRARVNNNCRGDEKFYHLHPIILDSCLQLLGIAARYGLTYDYHQVIPASVGSLVLHRSADNDFVVSATAEPFGSGVCGGATVTASNRPIIELSNVRLASFADGDVDEPAPITARSEWVPHIESEHFNTLVRPAQMDQSHAAMLAELIGLSIAASRKSIAGLDIVPALQQYKAWLDETRSWGEDLDDAVLNARIRCLASSLTSTPVMPIVKAINLVTDNAAAILSGEKNAFEVLDIEDTLGVFNRFLERFDGSAFFHRLGHNKPNLRVLELSAGIGSTTADIVKNLTRSDGQVLFSQYVVSDPSSGTVDVLKTRFEALSNIKFEVFDIGADAELQGFNEKDFDLIIAAGVLHSTPKLSESLTRVRQLLAPSGRLLVQSLQPSLSWSKYVLGLLPSWIIGVDDDRASEPYIDVTNWKGRLATAGLEMTDESTCDHMSSSHVMVARLRRDHLPAKRVTILSELSDESSRSHAITNEFLARGYEISYCGLAEIPPPGQDIVALLDGQSSFLEDLNGTKLEQLKTFVDNTVNSGILWITQPSLSQCADPSFGQIHGLARCIRSELGIAFATCEADDIESPRGCQAVADVFKLFLERVNDEEVEPDFEYIIEKGVPRVNRFFPISHADENAVFETTKDARLTMDQPGRLGTLHWTGEIVKAPEGDEVQVEIHAAGLNFRDVLVAMGIIELSPLAFGYEATGIVRCAGPEAEKLSVGDRVALTGCNVFASTVTTTEKLCEKLPDELDFTSGASMPLVFATAIYSLINVGGLEKGQSVLIHSGCGGVGLAAIQLALMIGADVYTTVSSQKKIDFLVQEFGIPDGHIFNSRNASFEEDLLRETNGRGVDLALNSLSGELLHATWRCIAKWGTLVEIGKRDLLGAGKLDMGLFLANRSYRCVDIDAMCKERPEMIGRLLRVMMDFFRNGHIRPIPIDKVFPGDKMQEAYQHMQQGSHVGKIVLQFREPTSEEPQLGQIQPAVTSSAAVLDSSASYLLVGGLGGLGRSVAVWMVQHGARHLTFLSRSAGTTDKDKQFVKEIESMGCGVHLIRGSVNNTVDVARAVAESARPLKGILQMTMVLRDQAWRKMTIDEWNQATTPKVRGTWNLHNETQSLELDFFILFSSLSGIVGQPGQANYASANTFLDAFVKFRTSKGLPCTSLNIGAVEGAGYLVEDEELLRKMKGTGWRAVQESELLEVLGTVMRPSLSVAAQNEVDEEDEGPASNLVNPNSILVGIAPTIPLSSPDSSAKLRKDVRMSVFRNIRSQAKGGASSDSLREFLTAAKTNPETLSKPESVVFLSQEIGKKLLGLVLRPVDDEIDVMLSLAQLGLDSMVAVEMRAWWKQMFGLDISVLKMLSMVTLEALGKQAAEGLLALYG